MEARHEQEGFAFIPHNAGSEGPQVPVEGEVRFGDASISLDFVRKNWKEWKLAGYDMNLSADPYQQVLFLRPA
jgi:hypothetical protein